jgi:hypothetical protein
MGPAQGFLRAGAGGLFSNACGRTAGNEKRFFEIKKAFIQEIVEMTSL